MLFWRKRTTNTRMTRSGHYIFNCRGTYTLSEVFNKSSKEKIEKLPEYDNWSSHKLACLQFTNVRGHPKLL